jgi:hypothetical protein
MKPASAAQLVERNLDLGRWGMKAGTTVAAATLRRW